jgi:hypothetical protein
LGARRELIQKAKTRGRRAAFGTDMSKKKVKEPSYLV